MAVPVVAIVGRPNVGKSSLLNSIARRMISIVDPTAGVTRDRVSTLCEVDERYFEVVDTGGYGIEDHDDLTEHVERQIQYAIAQAALILFVVDVRAGAVPLDERVARLLRPYHDRVVLVANKADDANRHYDTADFIRLGYGEPLAISAQHHHNRSALLEIVAERIESPGGPAPVTPEMRIAVVGRQNTGKSTMINAIAGQEHVIVSEVPGTTRDAVDLRFEKDGRTFVAIDTAGVKRKSKWSGSIEYYGYTRVLRSVARADVCVLMIDATQPVSAVDKKLANLIASALKPCVLVINKWDLAKERGETEAYDDYLVRTLPGVDYAPVVFTSARDNQNVDAVIDTAWSVFGQAQLRVGTGRLNAALRAALTERGPSTRRGCKPPRIYYATQVAVCPPTIVLFVNHPARIHTNYQRFLHNRMQALLPFQEVPIRLLFRASRGSDEAGTG